MDNRAWNWRHGKKVQVGGKACVRQQPAVAGGWRRVAAEMENEGRGGSSGVMGPCYVVVSGELSL